MENNYCHHDDDELIIRKGYSWPITLVVSETDPITDVESAFNWSGWTPSGVIEHLQGGVYVTDATFTCTLNTPSTDGICNAILAASDVANLIVDSENCDRESLRYRIRFSRTSGDVVLPVATQHVRVVL